MKASDTLYLHNESFHDKTFLINEILGGKIYIILILALKCHSKVKQAWIFLGKTNTSFKAIFAPADELLQLMLYWSISKTRNDNLP